MLSHLIVSGSKDFVQPHPTDPSKEIMYASLEGGENGVYVRGTAALKDGVAEINLPEHFALVASEEGVTVQVTPLESCHGLFVAEKSPQRIVVMESQGGTGDISFDYLVMGVRRGFEEHEVVRENRHIKPPPSMSQERYEAWVALPENRGRRALLIENGTLTREGRINEGTASRLGWKLGPRTEAERVQNLLPRRRPVRP
ncbi:MAG: hypothetical protein JRI89_08645 [Deltaproteobacteria bacterium]|nr:hypothetical protein [Deltaproteobacteria bacterium]